MVNFEAGAALRRARLAAGLTQAELAERAGVSRISVHQIEAGTKDSRISTLVVLFRAVGLELTLVPSSLREVVEDFIRANGRVVGQPAGIAAPPSIADEIRGELARERRSKKS